MTYKVGDDYRYVAEIKNGRPHYATAKIRTVLVAESDKPGKLFLENDQVIELVAVFERPRP